MPSRCDERTGIVGAISRYHDCQQTDVRGVVRVDESYDVIESLCASKAEETMIAFAGFQMSAIDGVHDDEGVLKIATFTRPDSSGYLTLTFLLDLDADPTRKAALKARFGRASQEVLAVGLGADFEMLLDMPLDAFTASTQFYFEEFNLYFQQLAGREREILEQRLMPLLAALLDLRVEPLEWLADAGCSLSSSGVADSGQPESSLTQRVKYHLANRFIIEINN